MNIHSSNGAVPHAFNDVKRSFESSINQINNTNDEQNLTTFNTDSLMMQALLCYQNERVLVDISKVFGLPPIPVDLKANARYHMDKETLRKYN